MILKIFLAISGITLAIQDYKERKINTLLGLVYLFAMSWYITNSIIFAFIISIFYLLMDGLGKPIDGAFILLTIWAILYVGSSIWLFIAGLILFYRFATEERVPFVCVSNILILISILGRF